MTIPAAGVLDGATTVVSDWKLAIAGLRDRTAIMPGSQAEEALTIATGSITPSRSQFNVETEAAASTDDLANILATNFEDGAVIYVRAFDATHDVVLKHQATGAGELFLTGAVDATLDDATKTVVFRYDLANTEWVEIFRSWAAAGGGEANTASSVGGGASLVNTKSGVNLPFKSIIGGTGITQVQNANDVTLNVDTPVNEANVRTALAASAGDVNVNTQKITGVVSPAADTDAANKAYVDSLTGGGIDWKESVRAATTANITLSGTQTVDGVSLIAADRCLVKNQSTGSQNGLYDVAAGAWTRTTDADTDAEVTAGLAVFVEEGTAAAESGWVLTTNDPITVGSTALVFTQFTGLGQVTAGTGLTKTGNTLDIDEPFLAADRTKLDGVEAAADVTDTANVNAAGAVMETDYNANTILHAISDDTPVALVIAASRIVGRKSTGDVGALTAAEIMVILGGTALDMADTALTRPLITDYAIESTAPTISAGTLTLNMTLGNDFDVVWSSNITTLTVSNWPGSGVMGKLTLRLAMDGTTRTVSWPAAWNWPAGTAPTNPSINQDIEIVAWSRDGGTNVQAAEVGQAFA